MSINEAPRIDKRTASQIEARLVELLAQYTTHPQAPSQQFPFNAWSEFDPVAKKATGASAALVGIAVRLAELTIERLNRAPEKNLLAFLDLLGASRQPPQAARVPLTFTLAAGSQADAEVPAGTQVAAPPPPGRKDPVVFETERALVVTAARLSALLSFDPGQDSYGDWSARLDAPAAFRVFQGDRPLAHVLYVGDSRLLGGAHVQGLRLDVKLQADIPTDADWRRLSWERWNGQDWQVLTPLSDGTAQLTTSGRLDFGTPAPFQPNAVDGRTQCWLRCRLQTPITRSPSALAGMVRASQLPKLAQLVLEARLLRVPGDGLMPDIGFSNATPLDLGKEFLPFGDKPRLFDTLALGSVEAFSMDTASNPAETSAAIVLEVLVANPAAVTATGAPVQGTVQASADLILTWECWNGKAWQELGRSGPGTAGQALGSLVDETNGFKRSGTVAFTLPDSVPSLQLNGQDSHWLRVRIVKGNYGLPARYEPADTAAGFRLIPETFAPPILGRVRIGYDQTLRSTPQTCQTFNTLRFQDRTDAAAGTTAPFTPFEPAAEIERPTLYMGFELPAGRTAFPDAGLSLYSRLAEPRYGQAAVPLSPESSLRVAAAGAVVNHEFLLTNDAAQADDFDVVLLGWRWPATAPALVTAEAGATTGLTVRVSIPADAEPGDCDRGRVRVGRRSRPGIIHEASFLSAVDDLPLPARPGLGWQYWNGADWQPLAVQDDGENFARSGLIEFVPPPDLAARELFGMPRFWLRLAWDKGDYTMAPQLLRLQLNTTLATQTVTVANEVLGSSNGTKGQTFRCTRVPVLAGQVLEVREPEMPGNEEQAVLAREEGDDAISTVVDSTGRPKAIWVRWHEVTDFYASSPRDRHYVIDHLTGQIRFGDSADGLIPPRGTGNLRLRRYQTGGGIVGNCAAGSVNQLKTTVPYIEKASNGDAAAGGAEAESEADLLARMPRTLRHRDRAVTPEDYEDLALLASTEVARALCVPLLDLQDDPLRATPAPGAVSLVVVPRTGDAKPLPALELLARVGAYLGSRIPATASLSVVGPLYIRVDVAAEIALTVPEGAGAVERAVRARLEAFLHPLSGGLAQAGWDFGRAPHRSDLYALIEAVPGVDHVRFLQINEVEDQPGVRATARFLVFSGTHEIAVLFEDT